MKELANFEEVKTKNNKVNYGKGAKIKNAIVPFFSTKPSVYDYNTNIYLLQGNLIHE